MLIESKSYFEKLASEWVHDAYSSSRKKLPIGEQRKQHVLRIVDKIAPNKLNILDIGSGGGQITKALLEKGHHVTSVDRSSQMLSLLELECQELREETRLNLKTINSCATNLEEKLSKHQFDVIICIGMIYYLENDDIIFKLVQNHLKKEGTAIITFRNKLFDLFPNSKNSDSSSSDIFEGFKQSKKIDSTLDIFHFKNYLISLKENIEEALALLNDSPKESNKITSSEINKNESHLETKKVLGRQHTPYEIEQLSKRFNLTVSSFCGIQPHYLQASNKNETINQCLQLLSAPLWHLSTDLCSLLWSSHFMAELRN